MGRLFSSTLQLLEGERGARGEELCQETGPQVCPFRTPVRLSVGLQQIDLQSAQASWGRLRKRRRECLRPGQKIRCESGPQVSRWLCAKRASVTSVQPLQEKCGGRAHFTDEDRKGQWHKVTEKAVELGSA